MAWKLSTALKLGRVSNLPTVWSNSLAGVVLAGVNPLNWNILTLMVAMSMAYVGGMFLNDAFDRKIDKTERPERPIPAGKISAAEVFAAGFTLLVGAVFFTMVAVLSWNGHFFLATFFALLLCGAIVLYNVWHKNNPWSPLVMGACRMCVYLCAGFTATGSPLPMLYVGALVLLAYLIGLTYVAKQEKAGVVSNVLPLIFLLVPASFAIYAGTSDTQVWLPLILFVAWIAYCLYLIRRKNPGDIPRSVVSMIAGIALVDATFIASTGSLMVAACAVAAFALTLLLQKFVAGT